MQLVGDREVIERDVRARGRRLIGRRCGDEFVEQRSEFAIFLSADDSLLCRETCELSLPIQPIAVER